MIYKSKVDKAKPFNSIRNILNAYKPDIIFIMSWSSEINETNYFEGIPYETNDDYFEPGKIALYHLKGYDTKVIWTSHPRSYPYHSLNVNDMIIKLAESYHTVKRLWPKY